MGMVHAESVRANQMIVIHLQAVRLYHHPPLNTWTQHNPTKNLKKNLRILKSGFCLTGNQLKKKKKKRGSFSGKSKELTVTAPINFDSNFELTPGGKIWFWALKLTKATYSVRVCKRTKRAKKFNLRRQF